MNTYLLWCRFEKMRGRLDGAGYSFEIEAARDAVATIASTSAVNSSRGPRVVARRM